MLETYSLTIASLLDGFSNIQYFDFFLPQVVS